MAITLKSFRETVERVIGTEPRDVFHSILLEGLEQNMVPAKTEKARNYYRDFGSNSGSTAKNTIFGIILSRQTADDFSYRCDK